MNIIRHPGWHDRYPKWRVWHTVLLYASALGLVTLGCLSVWWGYKRIPDGFSPRHIVGYPFVILGLGLFLRIPLFIRLVSALCVIYCLHGIYTELLQFSFFSAPIKWLDVALVLCFLAYGIVMFRGISRERHSNHELESICR